MQPLPVQPDLVERAYGAILEAICDGTLTAGARLTQEELAERLQVSRQPVMQALLLLKKEGFLCEAGRRGLQVAPLEIPRVQHLYAIRGALDGLAARGAAERAAAEAKRQGPGLIAAGRRAVRAGEVSAMIAADMAFHQMLYALSGNPLIAEMMALQWRHVRRVMGAVVRRDGMADGVWDEHAVILAAVSDGDAVRAERLSREHTERSAETLALGLVAAGDKMQAYGKGSRSRRGHVPAQGGNA